MKHGFKILFVFAIVVLIAVAGAFALANSAEAGNDHCPGNAKAHKACVNHKEGNGTYHWIEVACPAIPAHRAHGDTEFTNLDHCEEPPSPTATPPPQVTPTEPPPTVTPTQPPPTETPLATQPPPPTEVPTEEPTIEPTDEPEDEVCPEGGCVYVDLAIDEEADMDWVLDALHELEEEGYFCPDCVQIRVVFDEASDAEWVFDALRELEENGYECKLVGG